MPWKECSVVEERLRFVARLLDGEAMTELCREFGSCPAPFSAPAGWHEQARHDDWPWTERRARTARSGAFVVASLPPALLG
jgi:transposase-like protein